MYDSFIQREAHFSFTQAWYIIILRLLQQLQSFPLLDLSGMTPGIRD